MNKDDVRSSLGARGGLIDGTRATATRPSNEIASAFAPDFDAWVGARMTEIRADAEEVAAAFQSALDDALRADRTWCELRLKIHPRRNGVPGDFQILWLVTWLDDAGSKAVPCTRILSRGAQDQYPRNAFAGCCSLSLRPLIYSFEAKLARLRAEARQVSDLRAAFRHLVG
jgi:hypothetical protein